ncbi:SAM-dependent methyltransferase [Microbacterium sp. SS28]|uniref:SAM-dependent methyltransferase n=1 Tax=Microbacterium sp. SS28 TaxID=2919948 RepID=UPI001FA95213|nr:SAM-dependent methyltransferase [Microbacterium sp. SS28]
MTSDLHGVGKTAVAVAAARALESTRADALVRDPWAAALVAASGFDVPYPASWPADPDNVPPLEQSLLLGSLYIGLRTRFVDDALAAGGLRQIVILGSGLDTRSWRLGWPDETTVFELDHADVVAFTGRVAEASRAVPRCRRVPIAADVTGPWASNIVAQGFRPSEPTHWVLEGLLPYLAAHDQGAVLDDVVHLSAPGSRAVIERAVPIEDTPEARERLETFSRATGLPMDDVLARADPPDPVDLIVRAGWSAESTPIAELEHRYGRALRPGDDRQAAGASRGGFVTAVRPRKDAS